MLPRKFRLSVHDNIHGLLRNGARLYSPFFVIRYRPNTVKKIRCAVITSSKIAPRAVDRNRLRRTLYRSIYDYNKKNEMPSIDLAILPTQKALHAESIELFSLLQKTLPLILKK